MEVYIFTLFLTKNQRKSIKISNIDYLQLALT